MKATKRFALRFVLSALIVSVLCGAAWAVSTIVRTDTMLRLALEETKETTDFNINLESELHVSGDLHVGTHSNGTGKYVRLSNELLEINEGSTVTIPAGIVEFARYSSGYSNGLLKISGRIVLENGARVWFGSGTLNQGIKMEMKGNISVENGGELYLSPNFENVQSGGYTIWTSNTTGSITLQEGAKVRIPRNYFVKNGVACQTDSLQTVVSSSAPMTDNIMPAGTYTYNPEHRVWVNGYRGNVSNKETYTVTARANRDAYGTAEVYPEKAYENDRVRISAEPKSGYIFQNWTSNDGVAFENNEASTTYFTMPAKDVTVYAVFVRAPETVKYSITAENALVGGGTGGGTVRRSPTSASKGEIVTVNATPRSGYKFDHWEAVPNVSFFNSTSEVTSFDMPEDNVTITGYFAVIPETKYSISVTSDPIFGGEVSTNITEAKEGDTVRISATPDTANGYKFVRWESNDVAFSSATSRSTSFKMPGKAVAIRAVFEKEADEGQYTVSLYVRYGGQDVLQTGAQGGGRWKQNAGDRVELWQSSEIPEGLHFDHWESDPSGVEFSNRTSAVTTFIMPAHDVKIYGVLTGTLPNRGGGDSGSSGGGCSTGAGLLAIAALGVAALLRKK